MSVDALDVPDPTRNTVILPSLGVFLDCSFLGPDVCALVKSRDLHFHYASPRPPHTVTGNTGPRWRPASSKTFQYLLPQDKNVLLEPALRGRCRNLINFLKLQFGEVGAISDYSRKEKQSGDEIHGASGPTLGGRGKDHHASTLPLHSTATLPGTSKEHGIPVWLQDALEDDLLSTLQPTRPPMDNEPPPHHVSRSRKDPHDRDLHSRV
ncbi:uncharacterized protein LOC122233238 [Panthera tigris]|uniref:uncharacterized protein LOC122233238 n=1 Tax=Panthera tigris TaxID=9694 RepID=UPI001C6F7810|nr:uncharacterized protein LOC122233238 [Panthera tigris]XP_042820938.1 uncharacterized protein LOC122233238 [Panthera tigris]